MKKHRKGFCPPFIALGLVFLFMIVNAFVMVAHAADSVVPGSEIAPPGGSTTIAIDPDSGGEIETPQEPEEPGEPDPDPDPNITINPDLDPNYQLWLEQQQQQQQDPEDPSIPGGLSTGDPADPNASEQPTEPEPLVKDPVGKYPIKIDTSGITVISPTIDQLTAKDADLDALLYPSGLRLPTKYMDLLMCAPVSYSGTITDEAAYLLKTIAPTEDSTYTYAEYKAADVYLTLCRLYSCADDASAPTTAASLVNLDTNTTVNWMSNVTDATLTSSTRLAALISNYSSILDQVANGSSASGHKQYKDFIADHKGVIYSCGNLEDLAGLIGGMSPRDSELASYMTNRYSWWDYIGVTQTLTSAMAEYSRYYDELSYNGVNFAKGAPISSITSTEGNTQQPDDAAGGNGSGGTTTVSCDPETTGNGNTIVSGSSEVLNKPTLDRDQDTPVANVGNNPNRAPVDDLPNGATGIKEVASIAAGVFILVAVVGLWIIRLSRRGGGLF